MIFCRRSVQSFARKHLLAISKKIISNFMEEKKERNKAIYKEWRKGLKQYGETGQSSYKLSYTKLARKYGLSRNYIITIVKRELSREKAKEL